MNSKNIFRFFVVTQFLIFLITFFLPVDSQLPPALNIKAKSIAGYGAAADLYHNPPFLWTFLVASSIASAGILLFQKWARALFVAIAIVGLIANALTGVLITGPVFRVLANFALYIDGAILAIAFISDLRREFW
jgi:hypothetical protein